MKQFPSYDRQTRAPVPPPPAGSCDCAVHVFGDAVKYPPTAARTYEVPEATFADQQRMHRTLGIDRAVIVQATIYGTDHRLLIDTIGGQPSYRGVAIIDDTVSDTELARLHQAGVRAARFNFAKFLGIVPDTNVFQRSVKRIDELGWHVKIFGEFDEYVDHIPFLNSCGLPVMIDHLARIHFDRGIGQRAFTVVRDLLKNENWWIMLSNADRHSAQEFPWEDSVPFAQEFIAAAPDRTVWATDWPHVRYVRKMPNDADLLELLYRYAPEEATRQKILVDNPARLYGFGAA